MTENYATLDAKTVAELRDIVRSRGIVGFSRKNKDLTIKAILADMDQGKPAACCAPASGAVKATPVKVAPVTAAKFTMTSILTKPSAKTGDKTTTTIQVSCGANSADFPVVGKNVGLVQEFLKEVLNIDRLAEGQVAGKTVASDYVLKEGDVLEFIKPAGQKG